MRVENSVWVLLAEDNGGCGGRSSYSLTYAMNTPTGAVIRVVSTMGETESMVFAPNVEAYDAEDGCVDLRLIGGAS